MASVFKVAAAHEAATRLFRTSALALFLVAFFFANSFAVEVAAAETNGNRLKAATFDISGFGPLGNRELKRTLRLLQPTRAKEAPFLDANFVEDSALILLSKLNREGYLSPSLTARIRLADGSRRTFRWTQQFETFLPRPLSIRHVDFKVKPGVLYYYKDLAIEGLDAVHPRQARSYFIEGDALIQTKRSRIYTPSRLKQSASNLEEVLHRKGYQDASVVVTNLIRDDRSGAVSVDVIVTEGLPSIVRSVETQIRVSNQVEQASSLRPVEPYSRYWLQDLQQKLRTNLYARGFPDTTVEMTQLRREPTQTNIWLDLRAEVEAGPRVRLGNVQFDGAERTRRTILQRRIDLDEGGYLNRLEVERGRFGLSKLGVFDSVSVRYDIVHENTRDVIYELDEGKVIDFSLIFGYGSYEMLRGGFELSQYNIFGRAHRSRLRAIQSFKASHIEYLYTLPELFREDVNIFFTAAGLRRQEVSFLREEYGAGIGAQRFVDLLQSDVSLRYNYEFLNAVDPEAELEENVEQARVSSIVLDVKHDQRGNPLLPRDGYKIFSTTEFATASLGGEVDYQRIELAGAVHRRVGRGRYIHLGIAHGAIMTAGGVAADLPFNKRFFPGGENSVRGFQQGEASPLDDEGDVIGAESYFQANLEFEQLITRAWSVVVFADGVGFAENISRYPADEYLVSVGGGIRWKTIIGPARLEYGYNLNPRREDPVGTLHISLGFPF